MTASPCTTARYPTGPPQKWAPTAISWATLPKPFANKVSISAHPLIASNTTSSLVLVARFAPMSTIRNLPPSTAPLITGSRLRRPSLSPTISLSFFQAWTDDWLARSAEIVQKYHPEIMYFDWWIGQASVRPAVTRFASFYYNTNLSQSGSPGVINFKDYALQGIPVSSMSSAVSLAAFGPAIGKPTPPSAMPPGASFKMTPSSLPSSSFISSLISSAKTAIFSST